MVSSNRSSPKPTAKIVMIVQLKLIHSYIRLDIQILMMTTLKKSGMGYF